MLGFDYGRQRIGVAVGQSLSGTAAPLTTLTNLNRKPDWQKIAELIQRWEPNALIVGLPLLHGDDQNESCKAAKQFANELQTHFKLDVYMQDEEFTSASAKSLLQTQRQQGQKTRKNNKQDIDQLAATLIVQQWLDENETA